MDELFLILKQLTWIFQDICELILDYMEDNIFRKNQKSADRIVKFEYVNKLFPYSYFGRNTLFIRSF